MSNLEVIGAGDTEIATAIMNEAYTRCLEPPTRLTDLGYSHHTPETIARGCFCYGASDLVTRVAHEMGVFAAREVHSGHAITTFGAPDAKPADDDPISCLTWGQFMSPQRFLEVLEQDDFADMPGYFGARADVEYVLGMDPVKYEEHYSTASIEYRQVAYTLRWKHKPLGTAAWLNTTVEEQLSGKYPVGLVKHNDYPGRSWC